jgi:hypothetical protein
LRKDNLELLPQAIGNFGFRTVSTVVPQRQAFGGSGANDPAPGGETFSRHATAGATRRVSVDREMSLESRARMTKSRKLQLLGT